MIAPLVPYAIRGVIFYQGEHNGEYADQYRKLFPAMIAGWRKAWGQGDFPFLFVQIANWLYPQEEPSECTWAELRDVQRMSLAVPKTGMAVAIDLGEKANIHPKNKQEVGRRLALAAEKVAYGMAIPYTGPLYRSMTITGDRIRLTFDGVFGGLKATDGGALKGFTIAGEDRRFRPAQAVIDGETVVVSSDEVAKPAAVRYAWQYNPVCNLANGADLPASPFRTDSWPFLLSINESEPEVP
jgi:sialate O-acetylesterase